MAGQAVETLRIIPKQPWWQSWDARRSVIKSLAMSSILWGRGRRSLPVGSIHSTLPLVKVEHKNSLFFQSMSYVSVPAGHVLGRTHPSVSLCVGVVYKWNREPTLIFFNPWQYDNVKSDLEINRAHRGWWKLSHLADLIFFFADSTSTSKNHFHFKKTSFCSVHCAHLHSILMLQSLNCCVHWVVFDFALFYLITVFCLA